MAEQLQQDMDFETDGAPSLPLYRTSLVDSYASTSTYDDPVQLSSDGLKKLSLEDLSEVPGDEEKDNTARPHCAETEIIPTLIDVDNTPEIGESGIGDTPLYESDRDVDNIPETGGDGVGDTLDESVDTEYTNYGLYFACRLGRDKDGDTMLHTAIIALKVSLSIALVPLMAQANCLDLANHLLQTSLHLAVLTGQMDVVSALVRHGADIGRQDKRLRTPLHIAMENGYTDIVDTLLLGLGSNEEPLNLFNEHGQTCLHITCLAGDARLVGTLLAQGADVNLGDRKSERTALHLAAESGNFEIVQMLLRHPGIEVDKKTRNSETALILAKCRGHETVVKRLQRAGAKHNLKTIKKYMDGVVA